MQATPHELDARLAQCGLIPEAGMRERARTLYERLLFNPYSLRATTFHAFCQELLRRFPLEAGISPGFEISEATGLLEQAAWDALVAQTARRPGSAAAQALDALVAGCNGLSNTRAALRAFLAHRSDWWAYTQDTADAVEAAAGRLARLLDCDLNTDPLAGFPDAAQRRRLAEFAELLGRNTTTANTAHAQRLLAAFAEDLSPAGWLESIRPAFFTAGGEPRRRQSSAAQGRRLGAAGEQRFLELHTRFVDELSALRERLARAGTLATNLAWYTAGSRLLAHYQRIKQEQRLLDFADLEWQACELLNRSDHAHWVQYKLDARLDHLLIDEFQDTNPTQWRLLLPLLRELAAGDGERCRSVFLVGDAKQSIYGFRRADPALLEGAAAWLEQHLAAERYPLNASRRSAPAIIDCVNRVFGDGPLGERLAGFSPHTTHLTECYGRVELLPLCTAAAQSAPSRATGALRDPLQTPRPVPEHRRHHDEGMLLAGRIRELVDNHTPVAQGESVRPLRYADILILLRQRTHAPAYEQALREAGIPYLGAGRGLLLEHLEVRDLDALLNLLVSPYDNLALAQVLRSPIFGLSSEQLIPLAGPGTGTWYERLVALGNGAGPELAAARQLLERWRSLVGRIPVHDLLDRIYHDAELLPRYTAAFPPALVPRVQANLTRFIELALEIDNGRYPSLPRFLDQLERLRQSGDDQPDEGAPEQADSDRVRLLTIHGAKGLEAPVVFLADSAAKASSRDAYSALVDWPTDRARPRQLLLTARKQDLDSASHELLEQQHAREAREAANLLYVAITRARQYLFISGSAREGAQDTGWYGMIRDAVADWNRTSTGNPFRESGSPPPVPATAGQPHTVHPIDPRLSAPLAPPAPDIIPIAPSRLTAGDSWTPGDADGRERGRTVHRMLERLSQARDAESDGLLHAIAGELGRDTDEAQLLDCWREALTTWRHPALAMLFDARRFDNAWSEIPVQYRDGVQLVYGIIDRLVVREGSVLVVDYKTHRPVDHAARAALVAQYREQMRQYAAGAARLWPDRRIETFLLLTAVNELVPVDIPGIPGG
jgi:ATP-dependent helicase/nuclease subunit A